MKTESFQINTYKMRHRSLCKMLKASVSAMNVSAIKWIYEIYIDIKINIKNNKEKQIKKDIDI